MNLPTFLRLLRRGGQHRRLPEPVGSRRSENRGLRVFLLSPSSPASRPRSARTAASYHHSPLTYGRRAAHWPHLFELVEQQAGRVPAAVEKCLAGPGGSETAPGRAVAASDLHRRRDRASGSSAGIALDALPSRYCTAAGGRRHARQPERHGVAEEDLRDTTGRRSRGCRGGGSPAARARATSRSRSWRSTSMNRGAGICALARDDTRPRARLRSRSSSKRWSLESLEGDRLEEARRNDPIGVDVVAAQRQRGAADRRRSRSTANWRPPIAATARTSTTSPAIAAAATIAGLISSVRPVGLPCRPLKLRFDEEAQTSRPFEPVGVHRQAHRAAGAAPLEAGVHEHAVETFAFRRGADGLRSRHDQRLARAARRAGRGRCAAASRRSDSRPLVHEPMNATSMRVPRMALAGAEAHERQRFGVGVARQPLRRPPPTGRG